MDWRFRSWAGGDVDVVDPFLLHQRSAVLSVQDIVVRLRISKQSAIHVWCRTLPASSRSLLVTWTYGLPWDTRCDVLLRVNTPAVQWRVLPRATGMWLQR